MNAVLLHLSVLNQSNNRTVIGDVAESGYERLSNTDLIFKPTSTMGMGLSDASTRGWTDTRNLLTS